MIDFLGDLFSFLFGPVLVLALIIAAAAVYFLGSYELAYVPKPTKEVVQLCSTSFKPEDCMRINGYVREFRKL
jgi:hypothetical protein